MGPTGSHSSLIRNERIAAEDDDRKGHLRPKSADKLPNVGKKAYFWQLIAHFSRIWTEIGL